MSSRRRALAASAVAAALASALAAGPPTPASASARRAPAGSTLPAPAAAGPGTPATPTAWWNPSTASLPWLPSPSVDGEISVVERDLDDDQARVRSFEADGAPVRYPHELTAVPGVAPVWSPGGDVLVGARIGAESPAGAGRRGSVVARPGAGVAQWSPFGDSLARASRAGATSRVDAAWVGGSSTDPIGPGQGQDEPVVLPNGKGLLVTVGDAPRRDLAVLPARFPRVASADEVPAGDPRPLGLGDLDARAAAVGADGTLAFVGGHGPTTALYVDEGNGPVRVADLGAECAGHPPAFAPSGTALAYTRASGPACASTELRVLSSATGSFTRGSDLLVSAAAAGRSYASPSWRALTPAARTVRLGGPDRLTTAVAASRWSHPAAGSASHVVLVGDSAAAEGVVAAPLAGQLGAPLLLTPPTGPAGPVLDEIERVLDPADGLVYLVGGADSLPASVTRTLREAGLRTLRLAGSDPSATSVRVAEELDRLWRGSSQTRDTVFLADGTDVADALAAGPAATTRLAPVLLTEPGAVPPAVREYVQGREQVRVVAVGATASAAATGVLADVTSLAGPDRYATAGLVAERFFAGGRRVGYATGEDFADAVVAAALMGSLREPLLLTPPDRIGVAGTQAERYRSATDLVIAFGGPGALAESVVLAAADAAGTQTALFGWDVPWVDNRRSAGVAGAPASPTAGLTGDGQDLSSERLARVRTAPSPALR